MPGKRGPCAAATASGAFVGRYVLANGRPSVPPSLLAVALATSWARDGT